MSSTLRGIAGPASGARLFTWPLAGAAYLTTVAVALLAFSDAVVTLAELWWNSSEFGHGVLVPLVVGYVLWLDRHRLASVAPRSWAPGLVPVAAASLMWLLSRTLGVLVGEQTALMLMLPALALVVLGPRVTWLLGFVFAFPFVASPLWWIINPLLQDATAQMTTKLVRELGVPIYREGNYLTIAYGQFLIAEFCSGLRFLLASVSLSALFAYLNIRSLKLGLVLVLAGVVAALVTNWIRVSAIVILGYVSEMQHSMIQQHILFGWILFSVSMIPLALFGYYLARVADRRAASEASQDSAATHGPVVLHAARVVSMVAIAAALIGIGPLLTRPVESQNVEAVVRAFTASADALAVSGWARDGGPGSGWKPRVLNPDAERVLRYSREGAPVELYLAAFAEQRQGAEVINDENRPFDPAAYRTGPRHLENAVREPIAGIPVRETVVVPSDHGRAAVEWLVWDTARVAGGYSLGDVLTKLRQMRTLIGATPVAAVVAVATPVERSVDASAARLRGFLEAALPAIEGTLAAAERAAR